MSTSTPLKLLRSTIPRFAPIKHATSPKGFLNLLAISCIDASPNIILNKVGKGKLKAYAQAMMKDMTLNIEGLNVKVSDPQAFMIMLDASEPFMKEYFTPVKGETIVDVGAHIGKYTVIWAKQVGKEGNVIAIEPKLQNYQLLWRNIMVNALGNVTAYNYAAWNKCESLRLFVGESSAAVSIHQYNYTKEIITEAYPMDHLLSECARVDRVKIDVEGAETQVLEGLTETMRKHKPKLMIEVWAMNYEKVKAILKAHGYRWIEVVPHLKCYDSWYTQIYAA